MVVDISAPVTIPLVMLLIIYVFESLLARYTFEILLAKLAPALLTPAVLNAEALLPS
jgi:hypothetical protein